MDVEYIGQAVKGSSTAGYCFWINCLNFSVNLVPLNLIPRSVRKHLENVEITLNRVARLCQEYILLTLQGNQREQDTFHIAGLIFVNPSLQFWLQLDPTDTSHWETWVNVSMSVCVGLLGPKITITYLKSNTIWTSSQPRKSHINETSPDSKLKKFFPFEIIHMDSASFFVRRGHFIWNRWAGGFVTNQLQQFFGGCGAEKNMYSGLDVPLYASLLLAWLFLNVAVRKMESQPLQVRRKSKELSLMWTWGVLFWVNLCWEPSVTQALLQVLYEHCFT